MYKIGLEVPKPIVLKTPLGFDYFDYEEIIAFLAKGNCSVIHTTIRKPARVLHNLAYIEKKYCGTVLIRCHKSFIINPQHVVSLRMKDQVVELQNGLEAPLSLECLKYLREFSNSKL